MSTCISCLYCTSPFSSFTRVIDSPSYNNVSSYCDSFGYLARALLLDRPLSPDEFQKIRKLNCNFTLRPLHLFLTEEGPLLFTEYFKYGTLSSLLRSGFQLSTRDLWLVVIQLLYSLNSLSRLSIDASSLGLDEIVVTSLEPLRIKLSPVRTISYNQALSFVNCRSHPCSPLYPLTVYFHRILVELLRAAYPHHFGNLESLYSLSTSSLDFAGELFTLIQALDQCWSFVKVSYLPRIQECYTLLTPKQEIFLPIGLLRLVICQSLKSLKKPLLMYDLTRFLPKTHYRTLNDSLDKVIRKWTAISRKFTSQFLQSWRMFLQSHGSKLHRLVISDGFLRSEDSEYPIISYCTVDCVASMSERLNNDRLFHLYPVSSIDDRYGGSSDLIPNDMLSKVKELFVDRFNVNDPNNILFFPNLSRESNPINSFTNLEMLCVRTSDFIDFSLFRRASELRNVRVSHTGPSNTILGLDLLKNLRSLHVTSHSLSDASFLSTMPFLSCLELHDTKVSDISSIYFCTSLRSCTIRFAKLCDISALQKCRLLSKLDLHGNRGIVDISALSALRCLQELDITHSSVTDVSPISSCIFLKKLRLFGTLVVDLSPLQHCANLKEFRPPSNTYKLLTMSSFEFKFLMEFLGFTYNGPLYFDSFSLFHAFRKQIPSLYHLSSVRSLNFAENTELFNIEVLQHCTKLQVLNLSGTSFSDLSLLSSCVFLQQLNVSKTSITDLLFLQNCSELQSLNISNCKISSLVPLSYCLKLVRLEAENTLVSDLFPLSECSQLSHLDLRRTFVSRDYWKIFEDTTTIRKLIATFEQGVTVDLPRSVTDLSPFSMCARLISFTLTMSPLSDISPLSHCPNLSYLNLSRTLVSDISALKSCLKLQTLNLSYCPVKTIDSLSNCIMLKSLNIAATSVSDLTPLSNCKELSLIDVSFTPIGNGQELVVQGICEVKLFISGLNQ
ncbi:hypothetical protein RCL1_004597 [Eukaryota sp. TZLM3-RCL]